MPNPTISKIQMPLSLKAFRAAGFTDPKELAQFARLMTRDYYSFREEFDNVTVANSAFWTTAIAGAGAAAMIKAVVANVGSVGALVSGGAPGASGAAGPFIFNSDNNPCMYIRYQNPASLLNLNLEFGFKDVITGVAVNSVSDIDVVTIGNGLTNGGLLAWDVSQTLTTPALVGVGTSSPVAKTNIVNSAGTAWSPTASKWVDLYVGCRVGQTYCEIYENDVFIGQFTTVGPDTTKMLAPHILVKDTGATTHTLNVEVVEIFAERNGR